MARLGVVGAVAALSACTFAGASGGAGSPKGSPPASPTGSRQLLEELTVAARGPLTGYSRDKYRHWVTIDGPCNTREVILKRDGTDVQVDAGCYPSSGTWRSPYDGETWTRASDVDIDHVVPLAQSWVSGAKSWTPDRRRQFANDLTRPQLKAVTDNLNQAKGDQAPDQWQPPLVSSWCGYATDWIAVKHYYQLTITGAEKSALAAMLDHC